MTLFLILHTSNGENLILKHIFSFFTPKQNELNSKVNFQLILVTGKFLSEALIFESTDPQYDDIYVLPIELQVQYVLENTKL